MSEYRKNVPTTQENMPLIQEKCSNANLKKAPK